jgi:tRNA (cytidine/uridine-2'-O-)-methyltransferase
MIASVFHVVLFQPEIPPNTGNVIRLCANVGATLHLVHPLGFELDEPRVRRAGLDYHELACVREHPNLDACLAALGSARVFAITTRATRSVYTERFAAGDAFVFGPETSGLPDDVLATFAPRIAPAPPNARRQPQPEPLERRRSPVFEAWRQLGFPNGA